MPRQKGIKLLLFSLLLFLASCSQNQEAANLKAEINKPAPDFVLTDIDGKTWRLSDLRGKVVFINFWATWCPPCQEEMPSMEALYQGMKNAPFQMLSVLNNDDPEFARQMGKKIGFTFPVLKDPESKIAGQYGITGVPETFIIDPQGILREKFLGPRPWNSQGAMQMLSLYLPK